MTCSVHVLLNFRLRSTYHVLQSYANQQRSHLKCNSRWSPFAEWWMDTVITSWLHSGVNYVLVSICVSRVKTFSETSFRKDNMSALVILWRCMVILVVIIEQVTTLLANQFRRKCTEQITDSAIRAAGFSAIPVHRQYDNNFLKWS